MQNLFLMKGKIFLKKGILKYTKEEKAKLEKDRLSKKEKRLKLKEGMLGKRLQLAQEKMKAFLEELKNKKNN